ncbi:hypothetical protein A7A78_01765 [Aequorivita soesokkakensis]|uniref:Uncharacterized protein n=2 Tax=Aequorivita soesokkakensis TaxID=1385699 RepID=A0A1A9LHF6_9FLAO|nr:hypothetical protein A7A78_01765 [Aequorivita soesokkakensis]
MLTGKIGEFERPFDIIAVDGAHNYSNCENCRNTRKDIIARLKKATEIFPFCCESHRKLLDFSLYRNEDYIGLEDKIADKIMYSYHHVINFIDRDDWLNEITDYLKYVIDSFGSFPPEYGCAFMINYYPDILSDLLKDNSPSSNKISNDEFQKRINKIQNFIDLRFKDTKPQDDDFGERDLNLLLSTYDKWYRTFPFDLEYFKPLKEHFRNTIPILENKLRINKYNGVATTRLHTKENLTKTLIQITKQIITEVNAKKLFDKGLLNDSEKIKMDLILNNRELELSEISSIDYSDRKGYIKVLKQWFKSEKKFIKDITPYIQDKPNTKSSGSSTKKDFEDNFELYKLFKNKEDYESVIDILIKANFISPKGKGFEWVFTETKEFKTKQMIIALFVVLETENYLIISPKSIYTFIEKNFGIRINKGTYSRSSNNFKEDYYNKNTKNYSYTSIFQSLLSDCK